VKTVTINIIDEEYERLTQVADVLGYSVEEFLFREGIDFIVSGLESSVADNLVCRIWDTLAEAQVAAGKADTLDETSYFWHFYKMPDGRIIVEDSGRNQDKLIAAGHEFVTCGLSQDWKEAA
jgi:hypothetical protein